MTMFQLHNLTEKVPDSLSGSVVAIGNFDGVHRGHQVVLCRALDEAKRAGVPALALSFEPHPRALFKPDSPVFRLTDEAEKASVLSAFGMDGLLTLPFNKELAGTEAEAFVADILRGRAGASHIITGFNFHFGKGRAGSPEFLREVGERDGFSVTTVEAEETDGEPISSSRIRRHLGAGDVGAAADLLGYRWRVGGTVVKGAQLGRTLGYPTANLSLAENCRLAHGIYAVRLRRADGALHDGVASFGRRPTFDIGAPLLETFVFDFSDDLYGEHIEVSLFQHLRGEEKFDSAEALVKQMDRDSEAARAALSAASPLSDLDASLSFDGKA